MYYQFSNFTGRLIGAHCITTPYFPLSAAPLNKNDPPKIVFDNANVKIAQETVSTRKLSSKTIPGTNQAYGRVPESLRLKMERFQVADGVPVHLKGGPLDKLLFGLTVGLCVAGIGLSFQTIYTMAYPKKP